MKKFIIEQKLTAFVNRYVTYSVTSDGQKGAVIAFAQQKRLTLKEEIIFYENEDKSTETFRVKAEKTMDIHGRFIVSDTQGNRLGAARKVFKASLLRSTWEILGKDDEVELIVQEKNKYLALFRRLWAFLPYLGDIPFFVKYHFVFVDPTSQEIVATYTKTKRFYDHYELQIDDDALLEKFGWQTFIAQGVLLDALQGR